LRHARRPSVLRVSPDRAPRGRVRVPFPRRADRHAGHRHGPEREPVPVHVGRIAVAWSSRFLDFNLTGKEFGPVDVPAMSGLTLNANATVLLSRLASVTVFQGFSRMVPIPLELVVDGLRVEFPLAFALS